MLKRCNSCGEEKQPVDFHNNKNTSSGKCSSCKVCATNRAKAFYEARITDPVWREEYLAKSRKSYHKVGHPESCRPTTEQSRSHAATYVAKYPEKKLARNKSSKLHASDGKEVHHWSYRLEHAFNVIEMLRADHRLLHRSLVYDQQQMCYRRKDNGELLATRELHESYAFEILQSIAA